MDVAQLHRDWKSAEKAVWPLSWMARRKITKALQAIVLGEGTGVWDAIGAIARGKQVVMVGDPEQLPPTSFFDRVESGLNDEDVEGDLESILDECIA